jgi:hypothetical protein
VDNPKSDEIIHDFGHQFANPQPIHPGSFVLVEKGLTKELQGMTLECWVRPWKTDAWAGLITQHDYPSQCGYGLFLNPAAGVTLYLGDGRDYRVEWSHGTPSQLLKVGEWHHVAATFDGTRVAIWINGSKVGTWSFFPSHPPVYPGGAPLRLGAYGDQGVTSNMLDGDIAMPVIYRRALSDLEIETRFRQQGLMPTRGREVLACWPLTEEKGSHIEDCSEHGRHGRIVNHGTWMIGGPSFKADAPRFGSYDPNLDARHGHGLRLASDDLYDCGWQVTHRHTLPESAKSGLYVARFQYEHDGQPLVYHATFVVNRPRRRKKAPLLVLCASNTWLAYNGTPFGVNAPELKQVWGTGGTTNSPGNPPAFNFYRAHAAGQGTCQEIINE